MLAYMFYFFLAMSPLYPKNGQTSDYKHQLCLVYKTFPEKGQETKT